MTRLVNADVVQAAVESALNVDRQMHPAARASVVEHRLLALDAHLERQSIDADFRGLSAQLARFAEHWASNPQNGDTIVSLVRMVDDPETGERVEQTNSLTLDDIGWCIAALSTIAGDLIDATEQPAEAVRIQSPGEFAATWNAMSVETRANWMRAWQRSGEQAATCVMQNHEALLHEQRVLSNAYHRLRHGIPITESSEIDELPDDSVVMDRHGIVWQRSNGRWAFGEVPVDSADLAAEDGPLTLIYVGGMNREQ